MPPWPQEIKKSLAWIALIRYLHLPSSWHRNDISRLIEQCGHHWVWHAQHHQSVQPLRFCSLVAPLFHVFQSCFSLPTCWGFSGVSFLSSMTQWNTSSAMRSYPCRQTHRHSSLIKPAAFLMREQEISIAHFTSDSHSDACFGSTVCPSDRKCTLSYP